MVRSQLRDVLEISHEKAGDTLSITLQSLVHTDDSFFCLMSSLASLKSDLVISVHWRTYTCWSGKDGESSHADKDPFFFLKAVHCIDVIFAELDVQLPGDGVKDE